MHYILLFFLIYCYFRPKVWILQGICSVGRTNRKKTLGGFVQYTVAVVTGAGVDSCCGSGTVLDIVSAASHC